MSLCFIQLALKVPLLGSFWTAKDSGPGSPGRVRAESYHPQGTHLKPGCVGELGKEGEVCYLHRTKRPLRGRYSYMCVFSVCRTYCVFQGRLSLGGRKTMQRGESTSPLATPTMV